MDAYTEEVTLQEVIIYPSRKERERSLTRTEECVEKEKKALPVYNQ